MKTLMCLVALQVCALSATFYHAWMLYLDVGHAGELTALVGLALVLGAAWSSLYDVYKLRRYMWTLSRRAAAKRSSMAKARAAGARTYDT